MERYVNYALIHENFSVSLRMKMILSME